VPGIREIIIYHYIIYELLSQHYWGGTSNEEHVQLGLYYCDKWYNILLVGHCQKSIHSIQHLIIHVGLSVLALQPYVSILSYVSSFHHLFIFLSSLCPFFIILYSFYLVISFWNILINMWRFVTFLFCQHFFIFLSFSSFSSFFHLFVMCLHILWILTNLSFKLYDLHQNMCGMFRCYTQIMYQFHDIYVSDHLGKLSKWPF
jgi:hypothetical protein